jgi:hypothetical protein
MLINDDLDTAVPDLSQTLHKDQMLQIFDNEH